MTEAEWFAAKSPIPLLPHVAEARHTRKLRLFFCACFRARERTKWIEGRFEIDRAAAELVESWADGLVEQNDVFATGLITGRNIGLFPNDGELRHRAAEAGITKNDPPYTASVAEQIIRAGLLREIFGNPFHPAAFYIEWRTDTVMSLARQMYDAHEFSAAPILADALQDAGCDSDDILNHLRGTSAQHVRGCWALDLVLGKE